MDNVSNNGNDKFLYEILDDIQEDLHKRGKQLMVKTFNNKTEYIKFVENKNVSGKDPNKVEFVEWKVIEGIDIDEDKGLKLSTPGTLDYAKSTEL